MDLIYCYVPDEYVLLADNQKRLCDVDIKYWSEIDLVDLRKERSLKSWFLTSDDFFVYRSDEVADLLWDIKGNNEEIVLKQEVSRLKKEYVSEIINCKEDIRIKLESSSLKRNYGFFYMDGSDLRKMVFISSGETLQIFFKRNQEYEFEGILKTWARQTDYFSFQLGTDDE
jgi:hypothetical protein